MAGICRFYIGLYSICGEPAQGVEDGDGYCRDGHRPPISRARYDAVVETAVRLEGEVARLREQMQFRSDLLDTTLAALRRTEAEVAQLREEALQP